MTSNKLKAFELTLALIKPDSACIPYCLSWIEKKLLSKNFFVLERQEVYWSRSTAKQFYKQHDGKFFYGRLVDFMSSGPIFALVLSKDNAISDWRKLIGPTKVYQTRFTEPESFRGKFGLSDTRNAAHGSDSDESAFEEISFVFPQFDYKFWKNQNSERLEQELKYNSDQKVHYFPPINDDNANKLFGSTATEDTLSRKLGDPTAWSRYYQSKLDNNKHKEQESVEWFVGYDHIHSHLCEALSKCRSNDDENMLVLDIGSGLSDVGPSLAHSIPNTEVHCLDTALNSLRMSALNSTTACTFASCDVTKTFPYADDSVALAIDKGTSDAVVRRKSSDDLDTMIRETVRVLRPGGKLVQVTTDYPEIRLDMLNCVRDRVDVAYTELEGVDSCGLQVFFYEITKK